MLTDVVLKGLQIGQQISFGKTLLYQCALSAVKCSSEMKTYFERRFGMGKSKMSTANTIRNKLVVKIFAVVARGLPT